jgi:hypothetical protein
MLVSHGVVIWDNFWYGGNYPLGSYNLLYYWTAALLSNALVAVIAVTVASGLFAALVLAVWGAVARIPSALFAVVCGLVPATGEYPFLLGVACGLATLVALQRRRPFIAALFVGATIGCSQLAFLFLLLVLATVALNRRRIGPARFLVPAAVFVALAVVAAKLFATPWVAYPFSRSDLLVGLVLAGCGWAIAKSAPRGDLLSSLFASWGLLTVFCYLVPTPVGANALRLREFLPPLLLLSVLLARRGRPARAVIAAVTAVASTFAIYQPAYAGVFSGGNGRSALWRPALDFLRHQETIGYRIEAVPTAGHWESYYLPRAGYPIARGWYRQLDLALNSVLYSPSLTPATYRRWLAARAVEYVLLPHRLALDGSGAEPEARLLSAGHSGLDEVFDRNGWTIYKVPHATPILSGPAPSGITSFGHDNIDAWVAKPGRYRLLVRFTPSLTSSPRICIQPGPGGMTTLFARRAGRFELVNTIEGITDLSNPCA